MKSGPTREGLAPGARTLSGVCVLGGDVGGIPVLVAS